MTTMKINAVHMCTGCSKARNWTAAGGWECTVYVEPRWMLWYRNNQSCPFNPPKAPVKKKAFINPIKQSKRG